MPADTATIKHLIETVEDGKAGFEKGAEKLESSSQPDLAARFRRFSAQRAAFSTELRSLAASRGEAIDESGSMAGALHRGWLSLKDALSGSDPHGVLDAAEQGEDHAVKEYKDALDSDLSPDVRQVVARQFTQVVAAHDEVRAVRAATR
jgi:uncharacterized protein (TIGR02284 family)